MSRRKSLLSLVNLEKYGQTTFSNVYYDLIPDTIDTYNTKNKGKTKLVKYYGNSVVENQAIPTTSSSQTIGGIVYTNNNDGSWTVSGSNTSGSTANKYLITGNSYQLIAGHKYLITGIPATGSNTTYGLGFDNFQTFFQDAIATPSSNISTYAVIRVYNGYTISGSLKFVPQLIDLTLMFGAGNEPTTLTDKRIQALLNRGYIEYDTGTIKSSVVNAIGLEPYNIWDEQWETGYYNPDTLASIDNANRIRSKNFIPVIPNREYFAYIGGNTTNYTQIIYCDNNKNVISTQTLLDNTTFTTPNGCFYIKFYTGGTYYGGTYNNDICINVSSSLNGTYKPYIAPTQIQLPAPLERNGVNNAQDTFEVERDDFKWTNNIGVYTFTGEENFVDWVGGGTSLSFVLTGSKNAVSNSTPANIKWALGLTYETNGIGSKPEYSIAMSTSGSRLYISTTKTKAQLQSALAGKTIYYELATSQTITIPKGHLGSYTFNGSENITYYNSSFYLTQTSTVLPNIKLASIGSLSNMVINGFSTVSTLNEKPNSIFSNNGFLYFYVPSITSVSDFQTFIKGKTLFYETTDIVSDFTNKATYEKGGTITSYERVLLNEYQEIEYIDSKVLPTFDMKVQVE